MLLYQFSLVIVNKIMIGCLALNQSAKSLIVSPALDCLKRLDIFHVKRKSILIIVFFSSLFVSFFMVIVGFDFIIFFITLKNIRKLFWINQVFSRLWHDFKTEEFVHIKSIRVNSWKYFRLSAKHYILNYCKLVGLILVSVTCATK